MVNIRSLNWKVSFFNPKPENIQFIQIFISQKNVKSWLQQFFNNNYSASYLIVSESFSAALFVTSVCNMNSPSCLYLQQNTNNLSEILNFWMKYWNVVFVGIKLQVLRSEQCECVTSRGQSRTIRVFPSCLAAHPVISWSALFWHKINNFIQCCNIIWVPKDLYAKKKKSLETSGEKSHCKNVLKREEG